MRTNKFFKTGLLLFVASLGLICSKFRINKLRG